jgi:predicted ATP-binding protein involved in virulence
MYIKKIKIAKVRSIDKFEMSFPKPNGWHVLIGDNGAGKSTIIRSVALGLIGSDEITAIKPNWNNWLQWQADKGSIDLELSQDVEFDMMNNQTLSNAIEYSISLNRREGNFVTLDLSAEPEKSALQMEIWRSRGGWFSAGYGPFRRFTGGSTDYGSVFENPTFSRLASHLSLFGEDVALTEATKWLINLQFQTLENKISGNFLENLKRFINSSGFLPHDTQLLNISSDGVTFKDGNGAEISVTQMSDGYRSILSLTFELIRQLVRVYGEEKVFRNIANDNMKIDVPGVVLIDEVDVHLHPTWQTRIGHWFTQFFPQIQFIVTTHSPLVCRACENGSIWRLTSPGSAAKSGEITGTDRDRLIFGDILDAYGTEIFGAAPAKSAKTDEKKEELGRLNMLSAFGKITEEEEGTRQQLLKMLSTQ